MSLTRDDLETLVTSLTTLYQVDDLAAFSRRVVEVVGQLVPGTAVGYNEIDLSARRNLIVMEPLVSPTLLEAFHQYVSQHPVIAHMAQGREDCARTISELMGRSAFQRLDLYQEFFRKADAEDQIAISVGSEPRIIGVAVNRDQWEFSGRDHQMMNLLRPHVLAARTLASERTLAGQILNAAGVQTVTVRGDGRIVRAPDRARAALAVAFPGWSRRSMLLPDDLRAWAQQQRDALLEDAGTALAPLMVSRPGRRLSVRYVPDPTHDEAVLIVRQEEAHGEGTHFAASAAEQYGLSRREAEVLYLLAGGASNVEMAERLTVSIHTVHRHLQNLYAKLGVRSRTAAVAKVRTFLGPTVSGG